MSRLLPLLLAALAAGGLGFLFARVLRGRRERERVIARIAGRVAAATTGGDGRALIEGDLLEREIAHVLRVYGQAEELGARVVELEAERVLARLEARAEPAAGESRAAEPAAAAVEPAAAAEPAPGDSAPADAAPGDAPAADAALVLDRTRRLTESSFVAGSDALVRVRAALKNLKDWRQRLGANEDRVPPAGANGDSAPSALAGVFASLSADVARLAKCAQALRPLAEAAEAMAGLGPGGPGPTAPVPSWDVASSPAAARSRHLLLTALRIRGLAAELETGLAGLGTELRVLGRLPAAKLVANGQKRTPEREEPDPVFVRTLSRLETQLTAVATDIAGFTRDAEHLSRELSRIRLDANGRPAS